jgi:glucosamine--fructose-6-phosphate aminotransferase (isomerizing)
VTSQTYDEIRNQPTSWAETIGAVDRRWPAIRDSLPFSEAAQALFVGSGTSLYIAQGAAAVFQEATGYPSRAAAASEVFLSPGTTVPSRAPVVAFLISRSGSTSEAVLAAEHLRRAYPNAATVAVTSNLGTPLAAAADHAIELPFANDRSVVMTQSFTCMLLALQLVAADVAGNGALRAELGRLPDLVEEHLDGFEAFGRELGERDDLRRFVVLGLGPNAGLAEEGTLKLKEMTQVPCEAYNPLEFRHGPISIVADDTAAVLLEGERERAYLGDVERDLRRFGAAVAAIGPYPAEAATSALRLPDGLSDLARGPLYLPALQFLAYHRALLLGLDPDRPRNLDAVIILNGR